MGPLLAAIATTAEVDPDLAVNVLSVGALVVMVIASILLFLKLQREREQGLR